MRILYSHRTKSADGQFVHIDALTKALRHIGCELIICGPDGVYGPDELPDRKVDAGASIPEGLSSRLPRFLYELAELAYSIPAYMRLRKAARQYQPDVIYERYNFIFLAGYWLSRNTSLPLILEINAPLRTERAKYGGLALPQLARWSEKKIWNGAASALPVTDVLADDLRELGVDNEKIRVIPNGISPDKFRGVSGQVVRDRLNLDDKTVLGFTGFVRDWHGVDLVLDYLAKRPNPANHFILIGDGPHVPFLRQRANELNISSQITFAGTIQPGDLPAWIAACDITLQPRATPYASPLKLPEYMALGKAIVAPAQRNIEEILEHNRNALLFKPENTEDMFTAIDRLVDDAELRARLGGAASATISERQMTWEGNARRVLDIAQKLTRSR